MLAATVPAAPDIKHARARALYAAGGALTGAAAWAVEVPLLGIHLNFRFGTSHTQIIALGQIIGVSLAASLLGWLLLSLLERRTPHARTLWTALALAALAASLALPLAVATTAATTTSAVVGLVVMHFTIAAAVIPAMARTARSLGRRGDLAGRRRQDDPSHS